MQEEDIINKNIILLSYQNELLQIKQILQKIKNIDLMEIKDQKKYSCNNIFNKKLLNKN